MSVKVDIKEREVKLVDDIRVKTPELVLVKSEDSVDQQLIPVQQESVKEEETDQRDSAQAITDKEVTDSDLIVLDNNQALTTSLKVAEYFGKRHSDVIRKIEQTVNDLEKVNERNFAPVGSGFIQGTYKDSKGENRPLYYLNRDAFTFTVMGFTGEKAAAWKWRYIQAFNRMEEELRRRQETKSTSLAQQLMVQAQLNLQFEERLNEQAKQLAQAQADIKQIKNNNNGMFLRHEMTDIRQQQQLDQHETDIQRLQRVISDKGPREEIKTLISAIVSQTAETIEPYDYHDAYKLFYQQVKDLVHIRLSTKLTNLKRLRAEQGWSKTKVDKLNYLDAIDSDPSIWDTIRQVTAHLWACLNELKEA